jgi:phospholipid transport system transporter-binding protein
MLVLPGLLTHRNARDSLSMLTQGLAREDQPAVVVDATGLQHFDTSLLAVLLECKRLATARGKGFEITGAPPKLAALAKLYGVQDLLIEPAGA